MSKKKKGSKAIKLPLPTLKTRARSALDSPELIEIARSAGSANYAQSRAKELALELAYLGTGDAKKSLKMAEKKALAVHALTRIKRDYGKEAFADFVSSASTQNQRSASRNTGQSIGGKKMSEKGQVEKAETQETKIPQIPLKHIGYRAVVNGAFARVSVVQTYKNDAEKPVEAIYVFPLPDESTVTGCVMKINQRTIKAELKERAQARDEYNKAVSSGHYGALMEQERPNIFEMNVGGIEPGEDIEVQFTYVQQIRWQDGGGRFRIPLVVAPRFIPGVPTGKSGTGWADDTDQVTDASKITPVVAREGVPYNADIQVLFRPGFRCELTSPSHELLIPKRTVAKDEEPEFKTGDIKTDRDFILVYRSLSKRPEVAQFFHQTADEKFCQVNIIPPGEAEAKESDIIMLLDISGSMKGPKLTGLKTLAKKVLTKIWAQNLKHRVGVIVYNTRKEIVFPFSYINADNIKALETIETSMLGHNADGGTETGKGLTFTHQQFTDQARNHTILLISDGQTEDRDYVGSGARIICAGIDAAINDEFLNYLAKKTNGACQFFYPGEDFERAANTLVGMLSGPVLRDVKVSRAEAVGISDVFAGRPATIALRLGKDAPQKITITGQNPNGEQESWEINPTKGKECDYLPQIWAREAIRESHDKQKQIEFSLKYGVICQHTSFVAISEKEVPGQKPVRVAIPVELPFTWDYNAVFNAPRSIQPNLSSVIAAHGPSAPPFPTGRTKGLPSTFGSDLFRQAGHVFRGGGAAPHITLGIGAHNFTSPDDDDNGSVLMDCCIESCEDDDISLAGGEDSLGDDESAPSVEDFEALLGANNPAKPINQKISQLIQILICADKGDLDTAQAELNKLTLTAKEIKTWTEEDQAMLYYFLIRLKVYGLSKDALLKVVGLVPQFSDPIAQVWHNLVKKELGLSHSNPQAPSTYEWQGYIDWKFGRGSKPIIPPYSLVP